MSRTGSSRWAAEKRPVYDHKCVLHGRGKMHTRCVVPEIPMAESGRVGNAIVPFVPLFFTGLGDLLSVHPQYHSFVNQV